ncbi:MAG: DUF2190 family protein [Chitinophagaceae bacterium]|nr:DUF2190 family protein [Chitinophagaceae bacterium]
MKNYKQSTDSINVVLADTVKGGDLVTVGTLYGVATADGDNVNLVAVKTKGVFVLEKTDASTVIAQGDKIYTSSGKVNKTNTDPFLGYAWAASGNGDTTVEVGINV